MTRGDRPMSRRALLVGAGTTGRAALAGCNGGDSSSTPSPSAQPYDVIVVGAGPAGIAAARTV